MRCRRKRTLQALSLGCTDVGAPKISRSPVTPLTAVVSGPTAMITPWRARIRRSVAAVVVACAPGITDNTTQLARPAVALFTLTTLQLAVPGSRAMLLDV